MTSPTSRRDLIKLSSGAAAAAVLGTGATSSAFQPMTSSILPSSSTDGFLDVTRPPDAVSIATETTFAPAQSAGNGRWTLGDVEVTTEQQDGALAVRVSAPRSALKQVRLHWRGSTGAWTTVLGDQWERSYGDLAWRPPTSLRPAPWYLLVTTASPAATTHGFGVRTQPNAFCHWTHDAQGLTLTCDTRSGGVGVQLGDRVLTVCHVLAHRGQPGATAYQTAVAFCKAMCPNPRLTDHIVYGFNDWYYAYGKNTPAGLLADAQVLAELTEGNPNRPYCVIDDGWQTKTKVPEGQWSATRPSFTHMADLAAKMKGHNVRPGIWMRPLIDEIRAWPDSYKLAKNRNFMDPTIPEVHQVIHNDITRLREWGYEMIKHDFSTIDILGRWGKDMHDAVVTDDGWSFARRDQTTAEIINAFYATIRKAAGTGPDAAVIIGCNTLSHLTAGVFELNRIGDDTSGNEWHRNPQMGVNTLAFRAAHHNAFYGADADCCPITGRIEWSRTKQWLDLVTRSGTPLFVSLDRKALTPEIRAALKQSLATASKPLPLAEPLDWQTTRTPRKWKLEGAETVYDWA